MISMNYWEKTYKEEGTLWSFESCDSAIISADYFHEKGIKKMLVLGVGYGRNTKPFLKKNKNSRPNSPDCPTVPNRS